MSLGRSCALLRAIAAVVVILLLSAWPAAAQTPDDSLMVPRQAVFVGASYGHDRWSDYWEGTLKRDNDNVGTLTTKSVTWMAGYGVTSRLSLIAMLPYVSTKASGGTLSPQNGFQDVTVAAKGRLFDASLGRGRRLKTFAVAAYGTPVTNYVPDLLPLSIGLHSRRLSGRLTMNYQMEQGWFTDATAAFTWRGNVTLDRPAYYTDGQLFLTDQVEMPDVVDYTFRAGYMKKGWMIPISYSRQNTLGGGDIRRQDMPFVSNKMNFSKLDVVAMYTLRKPANVALRLQATRTLTGRNVGHSTTLSAGLMYTLHISRR